MLYLGALRELLVLTFAVGLVMAFLLQANALMNVNLSAQKSESQNKDALPVMNLAIDQEKLTLFTHSMTGKLSQISLETGIMSARPAPDNVASVAMSADASTIAILEEWAEDRRIHHRIDVISDDQIVVSEKLDFEPFTDVSVYISSDAKSVMSFSGSGTGIGWDLTDSAPHRWTISVGPMNHVNGLSPDGRRLFVSSSKGAPFICDSRTGEAKVFLDPVQKTCQCVAWSADGHRISIGDYGGGIHVFDVLTGQRIWHNKIQLEFARSVAFSRDGEKLAVGAFDEIIRVWDLCRPDQQPIQLKGQSGVIRSLVFTPSGESLISGSFNGTIFEWSLANQSSTRQFQ